MIALKRAVENVGAVSERQHIGKGLEQKRNFSLFSKHHGFQEEREWDLAIDQYSEAISIDPDYAEAYINRGLSLYFNND